MKKKIFALGFFDGVHLGHQALLAQCVQLADQIGACPAAITFDRHPMAAFTTEYPPLLSTLQDRMALLVRFGMEKTVVLKVEHGIMSTPWQAFLLDLVENHGAAGFVCGDDFRFGHRGEGDGRKLEAFCRERGLPCILVPEQTLDGRRISSTHIRRLLEAGNLEDANRFLGHRHRFTAQVVHGQALGRTIGVPTANLQTVPGLILPKNGVYAAVARTEGAAYAAVANIGTRPTVAGTHVTVEAWILDFAADLYGRLLTLEFCEFLRPEEKFASLQDLQAQIQKDAAKTRKILANIP